MAGFVGGQRFRCSPKFYMTCVPLTLNARSLSASWFAFRGTAEVPVPQLTLWLPQTLWRRGSALRHPGVGWLGLSTGVRLGAPLGLENSKRARGGLHLPWLGSPTPEALKPHHTP